MLLSSYQERIRRRKSSLGVVVLVNPEDLQSFHIETKREARIRDAVVVSQSMAFDPRALNDAAGLRAVWILVRRNLWDDLYELGVSREELEPKLDRVAHYPEHLDDRQVRRVARLFPELVIASETLRELYVLRYYLKGGLK